MVWTCGMKLLQLHRCKMNWQFAILCASLKYWCIVWDHKRLSNIISTFSPHSCWVISHAHKHITLMVIQVKRTLRKSKAVQLCNIFLICLVQYLNNVLAVFMCEGKSLYASALLRTGWIDWDNPVLKNVKSLYNTGLSF